MARGKTKSKLGLKERRAEARKLFARGWSDAAVAQKLRVSRKTIATYRARYEQELSDFAAANPTLLRDVLRNTVRSLQELDQIREDAWRHMDPRKEAVDVVCPECDHEFVLRLDMPCGHQARVQYQNVLLKAQDQRAKLLGVLGVKQEMFVFIANVKTAQDRMLAWFQAKLTGPYAPLRDEFASFIEEELSEYLADPTGIGGAMETTAREIQRAS